MSKNFVEYSCPDCNPTDSSVKCDRHKKFARPNRRAPVQGDRNIPLGEPGREPGTISWQEHLLAYVDYAYRYGYGQSPERLAERGGFGYAELCSHLRGKPESWEPV